LLLRHSKYSATLPKYTPTDYLSGNFAHWEDVIIQKYYAVIL